MPQDNRERLKQWLRTGEARLQPLTYPQRELWEAAPVAPDDVSNNICAIIQVRGALTPRGSEAALQKVVDRQEVFRLSILPGKEHPMQLIRRTSQPALEFAELAPQDCTAEATEDLAREVFAAPFDLVQGPLYRSKVLSRSKDDHMLVLAIHHAIADGWTLGVFVQDLFSAYVLALRGTSAALPPVPQTYSEWGTAERAFWHPARLAPRLAYWKQTLSGAPRIWDGVRSGPISRHVSNVPAEQGRLLREVARRHETTLFTTLLTAFQITISKWTGQPDITVGTPVANRNSQAVRQTAGYCSSIVPLRGQVDPTRCFDDMLRSVHEATVESFANAVPFAELVQAMGTPTTPNTNPIFEIRFALQNHPVPDVAVAGLSLQLRMRSTGTARFTLACEINEQDEGLEIAWLYRLDAFPLKEIRVVSALYLAVLARICHAPELVTSALTTSPP